MYFVCVDNDLNFAGVYDYKPNIPSELTLKEISEQDFLKLQSGDFTYDGASGQIQPIEKSEPSISEKYKFYLDDSDWLILRHMREKFLKIKTTLSDKQFLALERKRQKISKLI